VRTGGPAPATEPRADLLVEIKPSEVRPEELAKVIYRSFARAGGGQRRFEAVASLDRIGRFQPPEDRG
jgi:hypothetical protein